MAMWFEGLAPETPVFEFDRYSSGRMLAKGIRITKAKSREEAEQLAHELETQFHDGFTKDIRLRRETTAGEARVEPGLGGWRHEEGSAGE